MRTPCARLVFTLLALITANSSPFESCNSTPSFDLIVSRFATIASYVIISLI